MYDKFLLENINNLWFGFSSKLREEKINHFFTTRLNGKSRIDSSGLNLSFTVDDDVLFVEQNRQNVCKALGLDVKVLTAPIQVHSDDIAVVTKELIGKGDLEDKNNNIIADALITNLLNIPIMISVADCVPIIIADKNKKGIAVVHAGWKGTVLGIAEKTVIKLQKHFAINSEDLYAVVGPSIGPCCYQVDEYVLKKAKEKLCNVNDFFVEDGKNHWRFNLWEANKQQLIGMGIKEKNISISGICTSCNKNLFFSHRSDKGFTGRFSAIAWL